MPSATAPAVERLTDLVSVIQSAEGFPELLAALRAGRSGTVDGAWGSSAGLAAAALAQQAPHTLLVVIAHPRDLDEVSRWLVGHGFRRADAVELPGEFSRRGGILDVFSPDADSPYRLEFFGDEIESIRLFDAGTQRSLGQQDSAEITGLQGQGE